MTYEQEICHNVASIICTELKARGFHILRYDSMTTLSIYLKLDYGACNSIRISNHKGKEKLNYLYNVDIREDKGLLLETVTSGEYQRKYYGLCKLDDLIRDIVDNRDKKLRGYGINGYKSFMAKNMHNNENKRGFWRSAREV